MHTAYKVNLIKPEIALWNNHRYPGDHFFFAIIEVNNYNYFVTTVYRFHILMTSNVASIGGKQNSRIQSLFPDPGSAVYCIRKYSAKA